MEVASVLNQHNPPVLSSSNVALHWLLHKSVVSQQRDHDSWTDTRLEKELQPRGLQLRLLGGRLWMSRLICSGMSSTADYRYKKHHGDLIIVSVGCRQRASESQVSYFNTDVSDFTKVLQKTSNDGSFRGTTSVTAKMEMNWVDTYKVELHVKGPRIRGCRDHCRSVGQQRPKLPGLWPTASLHSCFSLSISRHTLVTSLSCSTLDLGLLLSDPLLNDGLHVLGKTHTSYILGIWRSWGVGTEKASG